MPDRPPLAQPIWDTLSPEAQAAVSELVDSFERRVAALQEKGRRNSTNPSRPPPPQAPPLRSPSVKRRPPAPPSGKERGGQPGHARHARPLVPPEAVRHIV